jgi:OmcA/MtrC family decaheme c-type cytochrome
MKRSDLRNSRYALFCSAMILGALLLVGCDGGGGSGPQGAAGPTGPAGPVGPPGGPLVTTEESCVVCHGTGTTADIAVFHPDPTAADVTLSNIALTNSGGKPVVSFHAVKAAGPFTAAGPVTDIVPGDLRFLLADLVPAGTATVGGWGTWPTPYFERWVSETGNAARFVNNGGGDYTYTINTAFSSASTTGAPDYDPTHTQRLAIVVTGHKDASGNAVTDNTVGFLDFVVPAAGTNAVPLDSQRMFVTADACKKCHSQDFVEAHHADRYRDTRTCVICDSPVGTSFGTEMQTDNAFLPVLIHQIHAAIDNPAFPDAIRGLGFGGVTFPQDVRNCVICHSNPAGLNLGTGNQIDNWKNHPTDKICQSCHTDVNFETGANHPGGIQTNATCNACHLNGTAFSLSVVQAHDTTPRIAGTNGGLDAGYLPENIPEFNVALSITPPANGSYYVAGETPEVRVTLTDHATGLPVAPAIYTTPQGAAGVYGDGLNVASLYVYGSRARSVPVLATGTMTDPAFNSETDIPTQEHLLFVPGADPRVTTNSTGFGYRLLPIPADMTAGTYMVRVRIGDYGRVGTGNYRIESIGFQNIQIGTATVEFKVSGNNCIDCHGTGTAPFHDERHAVVFNTDQCLACHDQSGNFAIPIANRVHAVHSANPSGDIYNIEAGTISASRDWSDVTFPQDILFTDPPPPRCIACHSSGDRTYQTLPYMMPCAGCHVGRPGVLDHMRQNGGPF